MFLVLSYAWTVVSRITALPKLIRSLGQPVDPLCGEVQMGLVSVRFVGLRITPSSPLSYPAPLVKSLARQVIFDMCRDTQGRLVTRVPYAALLGRIPKLIPTPGTISPKYGYTKIDNYNDIINIIINTFVSWLRV